VGRWRNSGGTTGDCWRIIPDLQTRLSIDQRKNSFIDAEVVAQESIGAAAPEQGNNMLHRTTGRETVLR
jgi:hypothetical protein